MALKLSFLFWEGYHKKKKKNIFPSTKIHQQDERGVLHLEELKEAFGTVHKRKAEDQTVEKEEGMVE